MAEHCGSFADSQADYPILLTNGNQARINFDRGTQTTVCYSYGSRDVVEQREKDVTYYTTYCDSNMSSCTMGCPGGEPGCHVVTSQGKYKYEVVVGTETYVAGSSNYTTYPFNVEAKGTLHLEWNAQGHLIASIPNIRSTLTGTGGDTGYQLPYAYALHSGPISYSLAVSLNPVAPPPESSTEWVNCLGGWGAGSGVNCALANCGGTPYYWNKWDGPAGTPWLMNGTTNSPVRDDGGMTWDLGSLETLGDVTKFKVYIYARGWYGWCNGSRTPSSKVTVQAGVTIPPINICPPELEEVQMERDICEYKVGAKLKVGIPHLGVTGAKLYIDYVVYNGNNETPDSWSGAQRKLVENITQDSSLWVDLGMNLVPNQKYCFKLWLEKDNLSSKEVVECGHATEKLPDPEWVVPEFTEEECEMLKVGDCVPELDVEKVKELQC